MSKQILHIGIDDTDSPKGMCTTFLAYKIINRLKKENVDFLDFPNLVRFNPNIPWKTRGNGAVGIKISTSNFFGIRSRNFDSNSSITSSFPRNVWIKSHQIWEIKEIHIFFF